LRLQYLELDIVARRGELIVVVEVRERGSGAWTSGFGSLDGRKRYRVRLAGQRLWQRRYQRDPTVNRLRFDAASVRFGPGGVEIEYVEAAF
jgi:Holliday junction resolvase-like predicted endonuclease